MRRERALWLASLGVAVMIAAIGVVVFFGGSWLREHYDHANSMCRLGVLVVPPLSGVPIPGGDDSIGESPGYRIDLRDAGDACRAANQRTVMGNALDFIGPVTVVSAIVFAAVVLVRRPKVSAGRAAPVARQSRSLGALLTGVGRAVVIAGSIALVLLFFGVFTGTSPFRSVYISQPGDRDYEPDRVTIDWAYIGLYLALILAALALVLIGVRSVRRGKRHLQQSAEELRRADPRPPVLYLRSFETDKAMGASRGLGDSAEEALVAALSVVGPVVALGEPGEKLPPLGAARAYTPNERWQLHIIDWAQEARQVVLLAGETPSFWWEVKHLVKTGALAKAVFLLPGGAAYRAFRERFAKVARVNLPDELPSEGKQFVVAGMLRFDTGAPQLVRVPPGQMTKARWFHLLVPPPA